MFLILLSPLNFNRAFLFTSKDQQCLTLTENTKTAMIFRRANAVLYEKRSMSISCLYYWTVLQIKRIYFYNICILLYDVRNLQLNYLVTFLSYSYFYGIINWHGEFLYSHFVHILFINIFVTDEDCLTEMVCNSFWK